MINNKEYRKFLLFSWIVVSIALILFIPAIEIFIIGPLEDNKSVLQENLVDYTINYQTFQNQIIRVLTQEGNLAILETLNSSHKTDAYKTLRSLYCESIKLASQGRVIIQECKNFSDEKLADLVIAEALSTSKLAKHLYIKKQKVEDKLNYIKLIRNIIYILLLFLQSLLIILFLISFDYLIERP